jgi:phage-related tail protein
MELPVTPEIEFLVERGKELHEQLKKAHETWHAINGAIQENNNALSKLSKMFVEKNKQEGEAENNPEKAPEVFEA